MEEIIRVHLPDIDSTLIQSAMKTFYKIRRMEDMKKKPSTSELLDWIQILLYQGASLNPMDKIPFLGALVKNEEDLQQYAGQLHVPPKE
jgi:MoxR-like ATPase